jgi:glycosyltransferase involved in cell wall biosynthesis
MKAINMENELFTSSRRIVVTTEEMVLNIRKRITEVSEKTVVIPNYVETDRFEPDGSQAKDFDVLFVGRFSPQKNISVLLMALNDLDAKAIIIGNGELRDELQTQFGDLNGKIEWGGNVPNSELPSMMNNSRIFVLPSHYEGHPKTLIEAMSCGMPIVGADSPGIREIIDHGVNGYLCGTDAESIRSVLEKLLNKPDLCKYLGKNARLYAVENFSLDRTLKMEYQMYKEVISESKTTTSN